MLAVAVVAPRGGERRIHHTMDCLGADYVFISMSLSLCPVGCLSLITWILEILRPGSLTENYFSRRLGILGGITEMSALTWFFCVSDRLGIRDDAAGPRRSGR